MSGSPLRLAFIGGAINSAVGYAHFVSSHMDGRFVLHAGAFSRNPDVNQASGRAYGIDASRVFDDWRKVVDLAPGAVDAVVVLTPTPSHFDIVKTLLAAGLPVICEKALAATHDECHELTMRAQQFEGFLGITFNYSGYAMVRELRNIIARGELGEIHFIQAEMPQEGFLKVRKSGDLVRPQDWRLRDGAVPTISLDLGVHLHHLVGFLTGGRSPKCVYATSSSHGHFKDVIDNVNALVSYDGLSASYWFSKSAIGYRNGLSIRVFGSRGSARWVQAEPERLELAGPTGALTTIDMGSPDLAEASLPRYNRFKPGHPTGFIEAFANLYVDLADTIAARKSGRRDYVNSFVFGPDHAAEGLALLEAIAISSRTGQTQVVTAASAPMMARA